ncbi:hypothetical protein IQ266_21665 [filamentous cyanobacterium LEGE 11480]|uniref:Calx-beta domain-containing protein n=1 Tax=Romeriopsis navalis LEGE 11480 TaxID=2777977 RepID=A0A928VUK4_9CYAN|nr:Calx-beta domain-containing protein [Romeriopsis navalis]MBE9032349.1 hypothetical protein [Romeriopsis navalis LEGE 11480]
MIGPQNLNQSTALLDVASTSTSATNREDLSTTSISPIASQTTNPTVAPTTPANAATPRIVFEDNFERNQGWQTNFNNRDTATTGQWEIANPEATSLGGMSQQLENPVSGNNALVTQALAGNTVGQYDIDNGLTSTRSPEIILDDNTDFQLDLSYYFAHLSNANNDDFLRISVVGEQLTQIIFEQRGNNTDRAATWSTFTTDISSFAGETIALLVEAQDGGTASLVEAAIDAVSISGTWRDTQAPTPNLNTRDITAEGTNSYDFEVTYGDDSAIDISTIDTGDILVTGPNNYNQVATFVALDENANDEQNVRTATYRLSPPDASWNGRDNGLYSVFLAANQVSDVHGNRSDTTVSLGDFVVDLRSPVLSLGDLGAGVAARDNATGIGYLMYSEELVEVRFLAAGPAAGSASKLIAVQYVDGQWYYDNNDRLIAFTPRTTDRLLAELNFSDDTTTLLQSTDQTINGIAAGYADGDLRITPNVWNNARNQGEFGLSGTAITLFSSSSEVPGQLNFTAPIVFIDESSGTVDLTINRIGGSNGQVSVDYATTSVSAIAGEDYTAQSGTLIFNEGETAKTLSINIFDDTEGEANEAFVITLENPTGKASLGLVSTIVNINASDGGSDRGNPGDLLPDLRPIIDTSNDYQIDITEIPGQALLRLSTEVANVGDGPLELWGTSTTGVFQPVFQRIYSDQSNARDQLAGAFVNHPAHGHFHFEDFAVYNLRAIQADGSPGEIVASGGKTSFCLINIRHPFPQLTNAATISDGRGGEDCGFIQGIDVGYADLYNRELPNQWIDVTNVSDGDYWLEITTDPENNILETNETNNTDYLKITLDNPYLDAPNLPLI